MKQIEKPKTAWAQYEIFELWWEQFVTPINEEIANMEKVYGSRIDSRNSWAWDTQPGTHDTHEAWVISPRETKKCEHHTNRIIFFSTGKFQCTDCNAMVSPESWVEVTE